MNRPNWDELKLSEHSISKRAFDLHLTEDIWIRAFEEDDGRAHLVHCPVGIDLKEHYASLEEAMEGAEAIAERMAFDQIDTHSRKATAAAEALQLLSTAKPTAVAV